MEGLALKNFVYCCGFKQVCKIYDLPYSQGLWKKLFFLDECVVCKQPVAIINICDKNVVIKTVKRCCGEKAINLRNTLSLKILNFFKIEKGTLENSRCYYNNSGIIYNLNNKRIATNEEFCQKLKELQ